MKKSKNLFCLCSPISHQCPRMINVRTIVRGLMGYKMIAFAYERARDSSPKPQKTACAREAFTRSFGR